MIRVRVHGSMEDLLRNEIVSVRAAATAAVRKAAFGVRKDISEAVRRTTKRTPKTLAKAVRTKIEPATGDALDPKGVTYSKALYARKGGQFDLLDLHDSSYTIVPFERQWLAIPTEHAPMARTGGRSRKAYPKEVDRKLFFMKRTERFALLIDNVTGKIFYFLVKQTRRQKKINILALHQKRFEQMTKTFLQVLAEYGTGVGGHGHRKT